MVGSKYYKRYVEKLIENMPTVITHQKETRIDDGYGGHTTEIEEIKHKVAIYNEIGRILTMSQAGQSFTSIGRTMMLTLPDVDLKEGELIYIGSKEYRIYLVKSYFDICKQVEIEVVSRESN